MTTGDKSIAFIIPSIEFGGAELQVINQINFLFQNHGQVFLIVIDKIKSLRDEIQLPSSNILELGYPVHASYSHAILKASSLSGKIWHFILLHNVQVVVANLPFCHYSARLVKLRALFSRNSFKLINYHHSLQYLESPLDSIFKKSFNAFHSVLARMVDDKNIFISESSRKDCQNHFFTRSSVIIYNSIPFKRVDLDLAFGYFKDRRILPAAYNIILPGRIQRAKGHEFFLKVLNSFFSVNGLSPEQVKVVFAGGGAQEEEISQLIRTYKLENYIHITGFIPNDLLLSFIGTSDLVVIPSVVEGFGNVALEALMINKLILASDAGGLKEIIRDGENGFLFRSLNAGECLEKLNYLFYNRTKELISKENLAADYQERFSFESHMRKLIQEINSCVE